MFSSTPEPLKTGITVYGKDYCSFSINAAHLSRFNKKNMLVDRDSPGFSTTIKPLAPGHNTIPFVFINGKFVGGFTEMKDKIQKQNILE